MKSGWIAYVGHFLFPWGQAASRRVYGNARSLVDAGYNVVVASGSERPQTITRLECSDSAGSLSYVGLGLCPDQKDSQVKKALRLLFSSSQRMMQWLESQPTKPTHVVLYGGYASYMSRLLPWCRRNRVALIADLVEWYDPSALPGGFFGLANLNVSIAMHCQFPKCDGVISISSYLAQFYEGRGCSVVRVPPTLDMSELEPPESRKNRDTKHLNLIYAGIPGKKDLLHNIIDGMMLADPSAKRIRLIVLGPTAEHVSALWSGGHPLLPSVQVLGNIPQPDVARILRRGDFSVFLRQPLRFANAGFPTKFVESMSNGTPVIANITSDLGMYLHDGVEGIVSSDSSKEAFAHALGRAMRLTSEDHWQMRLAARRQAYRSFDYCNYSHKLTSLFESVRK